MRHLRIFENINQELWLVTFVSTDDYETSIHVYADRESAENFVLETINDDKMYHMEYLEEDYDEDTDYETDVNKALEWYNENINHTKIFLDSETVKDSYKGSTKLQIRKNSKKYNI